MRGDATLGRSTSTSGRTRVWGVDRYFAEQLRFFDA